MKKEKMIKILKDVKSFFKKGLKKRSLPRIKNKYWIIFIDGNVGRYIYNNDKFDKSVIRIGNIYKTEKEAEKQVEKLKAIVRIKSYIKNNFGYDSEKWANWEDKDEKKYGLLLFFHDNNKEIKWDSFVRTKYSSFIGYLKSREDCEDLIKNYEKDLLLILK